MPVNPDYYISSILQHDVRWHTDNNVMEDLPDDITEDISNLIQEGYDCGDMTIQITPYGEPQHGYWEIIHWKNVVREYFHATTKEQREKINEYVSQNWAEHEE